MAEAIYTISPASQESDTGQLTDVPTPPGEASPYDNPTFRRLGMLASSPVALANMRIPLREL